MREFMTRVSDYWNERKNDPNKEENHLAVVVTGAVAVVIIVLLMVLLWGYIGKGRGDQACEDPWQTKTETEKAQNIDDKDNLSKEIHEEEAVKYMSKDSGEQLRQEYLTSTAYLREKVEELLETMTQVQDGLAEVEKAYKEADAATRTQITTLRGEVDTIVLALKETQVKLVDLTDVVQIIDKEKIPMIQQQIEEIRGDMERVEADISGLHAQMAALKKEDEKLWEGISKLEKKVKTALDQNVAEVNNRLNQLQTGIDHLKQEFEKMLRENVDDVTEKMETLIGQLEERINVLTENAISYRYEAESNTLYLMPMKERGSGQ